MMLVDIPPRCRWARQGSNLRPIGYEPTALPLSYGPSQAIPPPLVSLIPILASDCGG